MQIFKQQELSILNRYPILQYISIHDYLKDFIKENPLNYPYSAIIMRSKKESSECKNVKDMFSDVLIDQSLEKSRKDDISKFILNESLHLRSISFTLIAYLIYRYQKESKILLLQNGNNILIVINDCCNDTLCIIDKNFESILLYTQDNHLNVINSLTNSVDNCAQLSNILPIDHYYFEFVSENSFNNKLCVLESITSCEIDTISFKEFKDYQESCKYKYFKNIQEGYSIMKLISKKYSEGIEDGLVKNAIRNPQNFHTESLVQFQLMDKKLS